MKTKKNFKNKIVQNKIVKIKKKYTKKQKGGSDKVELSGDINDITILKCHGEIELDPFIYSEGTSNLKLDNGKNVIYSVGINKFAMRSYDITNYENKIYNFIFKNEFKLDNIFMINTGFYESNSILDYTFYTEETKLFIKKINYKLKKHITHGLLRLNKGIKDKVIQKTDYDINMNMLSNIGIFQLRLYIGEIKMNNQILTFDKKDGDKYGYISKKTSHGSEVVIKELKGKYKLTEFINSQKGNGTFFINTCNGFVMPRVNVPDSKIREMIEVAKALSNPGGYLQEDKNYAPYDMCVMSDCNEPGEFTCPSCNDLLCKKHVDIYYEYLTTGECAEHFYENHYHFCEKKCFNCSNIGIFHYEFIPNMGLKPQKKLDNIKLFCPEHFNFGFAGIDTISEIKKDIFVEDFLKRILQITKQYGSEIFEDYLQKFTHYCDIYILILKFENKIDPLSHIKEKFKLLLSKFYNTIETTSKEDAFEIDVEIKRKEIENFDKEYLDMFSSIKFVSPSLD